MQQSWLYSRPIARRSRRLGLDKATLACRSHGRMDEKARVSKRPIVLDDAIRCTNCMAICSCGTRALEMTLMNWLRFVYTMKCSPNAIQEVTCQSTPNQTLEMMSSGEYRVRAETDNDGS